MITDDNGSRKRFIAAWIRHACAVKPSVMRKVAKAEFGDFTQWTERLANLP